MFFSEWDWVDSTDEELCQVVDRLHAMGHRHTLEVQLRFTHFEGDPSENDLANVFSGFREKGIVTITLSDEDTVVDGARCGSVHRPSIRIH